MIKIEDLLTIKYFDGSDYTNISNTMAQPFTSDEFTFTMDTDHFLYIGYSKRFKQFYVDFSQLNTNIANMKYEYYNGTDWVEITMYDNTLNFKASGFLSYSEIEAMSSIEIDGDEDIYIRISTDSILTEAKLNYISGLLSDDLSLLLENPYILEENMLMDQDNHLKLHIASRDFILQTFTNNGVEASIWDLLNIPELKQAAVFLTLSKIYFNLSDSTDDSWAVKSDVYFEKYQSQRRLVELTVDQDDDGLEDAGDTVKKSEVKRIIR